MTKVRFAVLGGGNGAFAFAADLSIAGYSVNLYEELRFAENIKGVQEAGGIEVTGFGPGTQGGFPNGWPRTGFAKLNKVTTDIKEALDGVDVILVVTPAFGHEPMFKAALPHLTDDQTLIFACANWACVRFAKELKIAKKKTTLAEMAILVYSCRKSGPARVHLDGMKETLAISALPSDRTPKLLKVLNEAYNGITKYTAAKNVLETSLSNVNLVFHPGLSVLNAGLVEQKKGDFIFYAYGCTPSVGRVLDTVDKERMAVGKALGLNLVSSVKLLDIYYTAKGNNLYEAIQDCKPYADPIGGKAPTTLKFRYLTEDVPYALVPLSSLGDQLKVPTPTIDGLISLACALNGEDYWSIGNNTRKLGIAGMTSKQINKLVS